MINEVKQEECIDRHTVTCFSEMILIRNPDLNSNELFRIKKGDAVDG